MSIPDSYSFLLNRGFQGFDGLGQQNDSPRQAGRASGHQQGGLHRLAGGGLENALQGGQQT